LTAADAAVSARGAFSLALAGGSVLSALSGLAAAAKERGGPGSSFDKWTVAFVDERCVPLASPDSNAGAARAAFLAALSPAPTVLTLADALAATPDAAAVEYGGQLLRLPPSVLPRLTTPAGATLPSFDAVLLGVGPDAHVASLFPNAPALAAPEAGPWVVAVQNSPKPPAARVTLTLPALTAAANVIVLATGASKAAAVQRALEVQALPGACPAQMVRPHPANARGTVRWLLDADAAGLLAPERWEDAKAWPRSAWAGKE
jgi:6-phosphogluconolactonase